MAVISFCCVLWRVLLLSYIGSRCGRPLLCLSLFSRRYVNGVRVPLFLGYVFSALLCLGVAVDLSD